MGKNIKITKRPTPTKNRVWGHIIKTDKEQTSHIPFIAWGQTAKKLLRGEKK